MAYDLLIEGGEVIDPAQRLCGRWDVGISEGMIAALTSDIPPGEATKVIDARDKLVTPGLVDIHTHVAEAIMPIAVTPDEAGVFTGVTTVCDAGSTGYTNFNAFRRLIIPRAQTDILCFLHLCPTGQAVYPEFGWEYIDPDRMLKIVDENREMVKGIKLRIGRGVVEGPGIELVRAAKRVAAEAGLLTAIHIGLGHEDVLPDDLLTSFNREMLSLLEGGDILIHVFTHRRGGVINSDGSVLPELREAMDRGVILDAAPAQSHLSFELVRMALDQGIAPTTISTDITVTNYRGPVLFSLPVVMSKFLALGLSLYEVIEKTTVTPAKVLGEEGQRGSLKVGMPADVALFELAEGEYLFSDGTAGNTLQGDRLLIPRLALKRGVEIATRPRFKNYEPGEALTLTTGA